MLRMVVSSALYKPIQGFPVLGRALKDLSLGDPTLIFRMSGSQIFECDCAGGGGCDSGGSGSRRGREKFYNNIFEANMAISCSDGDVVGEGVEGLRRYYE